MTEAWYEAIDATTPLTQGDLINACPLVGWTPEPVAVEGGNEDEVLRGATSAVRADVVVMTQACDLEHDKVANIILCPHVALGQYKTQWEEQVTTQGQNPTAKAWKNLCNDIRDGFLWNLAILNAAAVSDLRTDHRIVDFHEVYTIPRTFAESLVKQRGVRRLRLLPPYREHLSQAFARFFMRVGLPTPVAVAW